MVSRMRSLTAGDALPGNSTGFLQRLGIGRKRDISEAEPSKPKDKGKQKAKGDVDVDINIGYLSDSSDGSLETRRRRKKYWANDYINGPLIGPEPSQVTGLNASHQRKDYRNRSEIQSSIRETPVQQPVSSAKPDYSYQIPHKKRKDHSISRGDLDNFHLANIYLDEPKTVFSPEYRRRTSHSGSSLGNTTRPFRTHRSRSDIPFGANMSQRPLDRIKRDVKMANRSPHLRKKNFTGPDLIDALDTIGGGYHHGGPFDATLASRNRDKRYAPIEAVKESNMEALRATPYEYVQDSLQKHVPLQGTATIPPGEEDMFGRRMSYEEGADVMREADAPGGAYKRYDHVPYHPKDYKGKGEPSFTIERSAKEQKQLRKQMGSKDSGPAYEMQPTKRRSPGAKGRGATARQRSTSDSGSSSPLMTTSGSSRDNDARRTSNTGKRLSDGIKRRFGSLRGKHHDDDA